VAVAVGQTSTTVVVAVPVVIGQMYQGNHLVVVPALSLIFFFRLAFMPSQLAAVAFGTETVLLQYFQPLVHLGVVVVREVPPRAQMALLVVVAVTSLLAPVLA
jgi:hypothetical protein